MVRTQIYRPFERFWHWTQAILILFLAVTGFEIHGSLKFFGFAEAVRYHNLAAWAFIALIVVAIFWHLVTGEWLHYVPTLDNLRAQANFYLRGIFRGEPHPTTGKFNPLQRIVYAYLKVLVIPGMVSTGLLYLVYRYPGKNEIHSIGLRDPSVVAVLHTLGAFFVVTFVLAHLYLTTTGDTATSNLKAMITGFEDATESGQGV